MLWVRFWSWKSRVSGVDFFGRGRARVFWWKCSLWEIRRRVLEVGSR